ncbi:MAG: PEP-CTERM sorting domain-containing protein [Planctomycetota bacterium]|nr:PEP-CTERM sorting domain-containing protein [Planctomycetota bacterium]MDA1214179.1 PEP-CTERM sorting domain-containing protein [Planctomycetota bacterium]
MPSRTPNTVFVPFRPMKSVRGSRLSSSVVRMMATSMIMLAVVAAFSMPASADLIYNFPDRFLDQESHHLSGMITVLDSAPDDGVLLSSEITAFEFNITGNYNYVISSTDDHGRAQAIGTILITPSFIYLPPPDESSSLWQNQLYIDNGTNWINWLRSHYALYGYHIDESLYNSGYSSNPLAWYTLLPYSNLENWVIAERLGESVPEPSTIALLLLGAVGLIADGRRR